MEWANNLSSFLEVFVKIGGSGQCPVDENFSEAVRLGISGNNV